MADIFISYANEDRDSAARMASLLESVGWQVWWDRRIPAGRTWRAVLEESLREARCMIVLWSENSINSPWVAEEAEEARRLGKALVPVLIERVEPPMGFRAIQAADLTDWNGAADDGAVKQLVADLKSLLGAPRGGPATPTEVRPPPQIERGGVSPWYWTHWPKAALAICAIAAAAALWRSWPSEQAGVPAPSIESKSTEPAPARRLTQLSVRGAEKSLEPSQTLRLTAAAKYSDGSDGEVTDGILWSSSDTRVATVDERGVVKAQQAGTTRVKARIGDVESSEWTLDVADARPPVAMPALVELSVSAGRRELFEKERVALQAKGKYSDASEKPLARGVEWQVSNRTIASITDSGELVALRPGKVEVVARAAQLKSAPLTITVNAARKTVEPPEKVVKAIEASVAKQSEASEQAGVGIAAYIRRAQALREEGNYAAALTELEKARSIDATNEGIRKEIEQTRRACDAERALGYKPNC